MAIAKVILNGETLMDVTSDTVSASTLLSDYTATKNDGTKITGSYTPPTPNIQSLTIVPSNKQQVYMGDLVDGYKPIVVNAISSTYVGSGIARKSSADLTISGSAVTAPIGYYSTAATANISAGSAFPPAVTITTNPTVTISSTTGIVTATYTGSSSITPTITSGYISQGTAGTISTTGTSTYQLTTQAAQTITPTTTNQTISSNRWLTGVQTIVGDANLVAENIAEGVSIFGINGTHSGGGGGSDAEDRIIDRTISGTYENSRVSTIGDYAFFKCTELDTVKFPNATYINTYVFYSCINLTSISFPNVTSVGYYAFCNCHKLIEASFPNAISISTSAFYSCYSLSAVSFPNVTTIGNGAFGSCVRLISAIFPSATAVPTNAFLNCYSLQTASFQNATTIASSAFNKCSSLTTISFPNVQTIGSSAFYSCSRIRTAIFPSAITIGGSAFYYCLTISEISFPNVTSIGVWAFYYCQNISTASFPNVTTIGSYAFNYCYHLLSFYLLGSSVATLGSTNVFNSTPISNYTTSTGGVYGSIFVPASLYDSYITATNWSAYSARIVSV